MKLANKIFHKINGLNYIQEFLCLSKGDMQNPLHVYLVTPQKKILKEISFEHLIIGYSIAAFWDYGTYNPNAYTHMSFANESYLPGEIINNKKELATLLLKKIHQFIIDDLHISYYEAVKGEHKFTNSFHQLIFDLHNVLFNKKKGNIYLTNRVYKTVQVVYSLPRKVCLITVGSDEKYNIFPTDLHGMINGYYIISLRIGGKACSQVEENKKILISDIHSSNYIKVYSLGKNHMKELVAKENFDFIDGHSELYNLPLPKGLIEYKELELLSSFAHGIHKFMFFKITNTKKIADNKHALAHIHKCYATWRDKNGIKSEYLLR